MPRNGLPILNPAFSAALSILLAQSPGALQAVTTVAESLMTSLYLIESTLYRRISKENILVTIGIAGMHQIGCKKHTKLEPQMALSLRVLLICTASFC